ncbi:SMC-Scp complex subunit ScpB [Candidatus Woesearchaeota archaeon]|jgi:segregation and condensation protein B|nr:SMC-Scp complex subunit ScpB [Candidatus Woesearchaeota archaeon]MBT6519377.1 SMC-Scp complex subunit ScpB [Candidatus Woesearchaeota archaeon]MBT7368595.1 SMC-Scp complex subunit ScpB [Candidatus Woesearchaeota archaeon]
MSEIPDLKKEIEAILFSAGRVILLSEFIHLLGVDENSVKENVEQLRQEHIDRDSPILLIHEGEGWKLTIREKYLGLVHSINPHTEMSKAILETLAIIAWKQPILQSEIVRIRSNKAYEHIKELVEQGFISKDRQGRSYLVKTTQKFLDYFDLPHKKAINEVFQDFEDLKNVLPQKKVDDFEQKGDSKMNSSNSKINSEDKSKNSSENISNSDLGSDQENDSEKIGDLDVYDSEPVLETLETIDELNTKTDDEKPEEKLGDLDVVDVPEESVNETEQSVDNNNSDESEDDVVDSDQEPVDSNNIVDAEGDDLEGADKAKQLAQQILEEHKDPEELALTNHTTHEEDIPDKRDLHPELEEFVAGEKIESESLPEQSVPDSHVPLDEQDIEDQKQTQSDEDSSDDEKIDDDSEEIPQDAMPIKHDENHNEDSDETDQSSK